jgi:hypothetical protein
MVGSTDGGTEGSTLGSTEGSGVGSVDGAIDVWADGSLEVAGWTATTVASGVGAGLAASSAGRLATGISRPPLERTNAKDAAVDAMRIRMAPKIALVSVRARGMDRAVWRAINDPRR